MSGIIPASQPLRLTDLIAMPAHGVASRTLAKTGGGNVTLFAFDAGEGLSEHRAAFDALVLVLDGALTVTIGGDTRAVDTGTILRLPADVPHALEATTPTRMLLIMLRGT